jgi:hypothetical protein
MGQGCPEGVNKLQALNFFFYGLTSWWVTKKSLVAQKAPPMCCCTVDGGFMVIGVYWHANNARGCLLLWATFRLHPSMLLPTWFGVAGCSAIAKTLTACAAKQHAEKIQKQCIVPVCQL